MTKARTVFEELAEGYALTANACTLRELNILRRDLEQGIRVLTAARAALDLAPGELQTLLPDPMVDGLTQRLKEVTDERDEAISRLRAYARESALIAPVGSAC